MKRFSMLTVSMAIVLGMFISPGYSTIITLNPTIDTYVSDSEPNRSFGSTNPLAAGTHSTSGYTNRIYLKFDLSAIPDNSIINSANLTLYYGGGSNTSVYYSLYHVPNDNSITDAMTWNTQPGTGNYLDRVLYRFVDPSAKTWNLLATSNAWNYSYDLQDNSLSLLIRYDGTEPTSSTLAQFWSVENSGSTFDPRLVIDYQVRPVPIPAAVWLLGSGLIGLIGIRRFKK